MRGSYADEERKLVDLSGQRPDIVDPGTGEVSCVACDSERWE